jgi:hypothetical protein
MKTNQTLTRQMGSFSVYQRTSDGMFNATALLKQWNGHSGQQKNMGQYFDQSSVSEFIVALCEDENIDCTDFIKHRNSAKNSLPGIYTKKRGIDGGTWMHPLLFIDFAMWLNPAFKVKVLKFVYDQLIQYRNEAGDTYREMAASIASISKKSEIAENITSIASALNHIVYGRHEKEIRNKKAEEETMRELVKLQIKVSELIKEGFIKTYDQLINYLRKIWMEKYQPKELAS